jgi:hypothetical protein
MGNVGSALSNDQGTFNKEWNLDSNLLTLASEFGILQDTPFVKIALYVLIRVLPIEDINSIIEYCLILEHILDVTFSFLTFSLFYAKLQNVRWQRIMTSFYPII